MQNARQTRRIQSMEGIHGAIRLCALIRSPSGPTVRSDRGGGAARVRGGDQQMATFQFIERNFSRLPAGRDGANDIFDDVFFPNHFSKINLIIIFAMQFVQTLDALME